MDMEFSYGEPSTIDGLTERLRSLEDEVDQVTNPHNRFVILSIREALEAQEGNFGVGAALVADGVVVKADHNRVFKPHFRSDLHAEMSVLTDVEEASRGNFSMHQGAILYTSLEPCMMCFCRIISAGVSKVFFAAADPDAVSKQVPPVWAEIMHGSRTEFAQADCAETPKQLALDVVMYSAGDLNRKLQTRID